MTTPLPPPTVGSGALYAPSAALTSSSVPPPQPRFAPVAHFASLPNDGVGNDALLRQSPAARADGGIPTAGRLLAINGNYIAYAVKKGLVRVIDRRSAAKTLLRGHDEATRMVDAAFFGETSGREGVGGLWDQLAALKRQRSGHVAGGASSKLPLPPAAASDVLATLSGASSKSDASSIFVWRIHSSNGLEADKLLEVRYGKASRIAWHPFNPNRFLLLRRNLPDDADASEGGGGGGGGRTVATFVETTRLVTRKSEGEGHAVCDCVAREAGSGAVPGMVPLAVRDEEGTDLALAGANDASWSKRDAKHVLTGHDDGCVRLWDLTAAVHPGGEGEPSAVSCVAAVDVASAVGSHSKRVTRVLFLSQYEDGTTDNAATPPFVAGTDMNHTITLWSSFPSVGASIGPPARLRVFGLRDGPAASFPLSSMINAELIPAPYRPPLASEADEVTAPSSFLTLAERTSGAVHALHLDTAWKAGEGDAVAVRGFDYVTTLNVVHPVYSHCVGPSSAEGDGQGHDLREEKDVDLCCIQSKAVQMLTLSAEMCAPPEDVAAGAGLERTALAPGVTLLDLPAEASDDDEDVDEEEFEEEYDMDEDGTGGEYSTNDSGDDDDDEDEEEQEDAAPTATEGEPNAFSNWLGAIAGPFVGGKEEQAPAAPPAPAAPSISPPPPGLDFPSILPPPPGMAPSPPPEPVALLSPMHILSESGSDLEHAKSTSPVPMPAKAPNPVPPPKAAAATKPAKKPAKKKENAKKAPAANQPAGPMKILQREEPKVAPAGVAAPGAEAGSVEGAVHTAIDSHVKATEAELLASIRNIVATEVSSQVGSAVRSAVKDSFKEANKPGKASTGKPADKSIEQAVQRGVAAGLSGGLTTGLQKAVEGSLERSLASALAENGALGKKLERHAKQSAERAAREAVAAVQPLITNSLNQTMREAMIPAYETATRQMFQQTSASLEQGLQQMSLNQQSNGSASLAPTLQAMSAQMMKMTEAMQALSAEVVQLRGAVNAGGAGSQNAVAPPQGAPAQPVGIRPEIAALCQAQRYEEAFTKAVSASNGDVVLFACKNADTNAVFNGEVSVSQPILICLMQQLGAVLVTATDPEDIKTILKWLQEIAVTIDPSNPNIQRHVGTVVQQLLANINSKMSNCDPAFRRPLQTLMQVIRGLL